MNIALHCRLSCAPLFQHPHFLVLVQFHRFLLFCFWTGWCTDANFAIHDDCLVLINLSGNLKIIPKDLLLNWQNLERQNVSETFMDSDVISLGVDCALPLSSET